jgi:hypothetical protein
MTIKKNKDEIVSDLYKLCTVVLPEKSIWSLDELYTSIYNETESDAALPVRMEELKQVLRDLEQKQAVIFVDGFKSINLVRPQLEGLVNS